ncbi:MAG: hypothetical protein H0W74_13410 [Sphingosinicella sp.]|nr:hypothetical protein [Sphingosinicella sp.]
MPQKRRKRLIPSLFGDVPIRAINDALKLELDPGQAVMSVNAQRHAQKRHPKEFARCFPHVAAIIGNPLYVRDDYRNDGKIELVGRPIALGEYLLVAVEISLDVDGRYNVTSFYPISEQKVERRRDAGTLKRLRLI